MFVMRNLACLKYINLYTLWTQILVQEYGPGRKKVKNLICLLKLREWVYSLTLMVANVFCLGDRNDCLVVQRVSSRPRGPGLNSSYLQTSGEPAILKWLGVSKHRKRFNGKEQRALSMLPGSITGLNRHFSRNEKLFTGSGKIFETLQMNANEPSPMLSN